MTDNNKNTELETALIDTLLEVKDYLNMSTYIMQKDFKARMDKLADQVQKDKAELAQLEIENERKNREFEIKDKEFEIKDREIEIKDRELKIKSRNLWIAGISVSTGVLALLISAIALYLKQAS